MTEVNRKPDQVDANYAAFKSILRGLLETDAGKYAVMHNGSLADTFDTVSDAVKYGNRAFGVGNYSIQHITSRPAELGYHAMRYTAI
ncbi:MAG TPA: hypothetical protein VKV77_11200 [Methylovirgula sp.]|nr:hypothetical protein [Methylovirgula sp.]